MSSAGSASWECISKKVFWDRDVALERWRERVAQGHHSYLPASIATMTPAEFVRFYGLAEFKRDWPTMRALLPADTMQHTGIFDLVWSVAVGGGWNLKPTQDFLALPEKRRAFLTHVARYPGKSIDEIARQLGLQYRRAQDHASWLTKAGNIKRVAVTEKGRSQIRLFPTCRG